jgi:hypothetical protein
MILRVFTFVCFQHGSQSDYIRLTATRSKISSHRVARSRVPTRYYAAPSTIAAIAYAVSAVRTSRLVQLSLTVADTAVGPTFKMVMISCLRVIRFTGRF